MCSVMSDTRLPASSISSASETRATDSRNSSRLSYSPAAPASSAMFSMRPCGFDGVLGLERGPYPVRSATASTTTPGPAPASTIGRRSSSRARSSAAPLTALPGHARLGGVVESVDERAAAGRGPSAARRSTEVSPTPRRGTFTMRRADTSSEGLPSSRT